MSRSILFSVITPVLNGQCFVPQFVHCLKTQRYTSWEALIVDDGSSDRIIDLLQSLTSNDPRFVLLRNPRIKQINGPYQARNHALSLVRGDYICFLDIDDFWHPERLAYLLGLLRDPLLSLFLLIHRTIELTLQEAWHSGVFLLGLYLRSS